jgi:hypothetical protein
MEMRCFLRGRSQLHFSHGATAPSGPGSPYYQGFTITLSHATLGRTPLDELSVLHKDPYLAKHNTRKRQASMSPVGLETANSSKREAADPRLRRTRPLGSPQLKYNFS